MPNRVAFVAVLIAALAALTSPASAGTNGSWTMLGQPNLDNIDQVALARTPDGVLHAIWTIPSHNNGGGGDDLVHDAIAPNGSAGAVNPITTGWATLASVPDLVTEPDSSLRAFFGGIRTTNPNEPNSNMNTATSPPSGAAWTVPAGTIVKGDSAYAGDDGAAVLGDGTPFVSFGGTGAGTFVHRGLDPNTPNFELQGQLGGCCGYSPDVAVDPTGPVFAAWVSNATNKEGVFAQSLDPATGAPSGAPAHMPGSSTVFNGVDQSNQQLQRVPIVARAGGGVFVAYPGGYPTTKKVLLWHVAGPTSTTVGSSDSDHIVGLAADPSGRIWVFWADHATSVPLVFARRSNKKVTGFGPAVKIGPPAGQQSAYKIDGNAQTGALDLVVLFGGINNQAQFHTQVLPGLGIKAKPAKIKKGQATAVKFTVSDPDPVKGAKVKVAGKSATTDAGGHATITLTIKKTVTATATKAGYTSGTTKVKVKH